jgi:hypothetical protein
MGRPGGRHGRARPRAVPLPVDLHEWPVTELGLAIPFTAQNDPS